MTFLLNWSLKVSVILIFALIAIRLLRSQSAALRHWVLSAAMLCAALIPVLSLIVPTMDVTVKTPIASFVTVVTEPAPEPAPAVAPAAKTIVTSNRVPQRRESHANQAGLNPAPRRPSLPFPTPAPLPAPAVSVRTTLTWIWIAGVLLGFAGLIGGIARLAWVAAGSERLLDIRWTAIASKISSDYRLSRPLRLLRTPRHGLLATWGVLRPEVLLPSNSLDWPDARIDVVLSHELAHIRRGDWVIQILSQMVRAFYWFNPLVWIVCNRLNQESEQASDDAVLSRGVTGTDYAAHLLSLARTFSGPAHAWTPALMMARESTFKKRFKAMLNPRLNRAALTRIPVLGTMAALLVVTLPVVALRVSGQSASRLSKTVASAMQQITAGETALIAMLPQISSSQPLVPGVPGIQGTMVRWGTNDPISDVDVELARIEGTAAHPLGPLVYPPGNYSPGIRLLQNYPNPTDIAHARTKADGKFTFTNLLPGKYRLWAARAGRAYYAAEYGQRNPRGPGMNFQFAEGQVINDLKFPMAANGTISGIVFDADGAPAAHVRVMAFEATYNSGRRLFGMTEGTETDDHGEYRLYFLPPGKYTIAARPEDPRRRYAVLSSPISAAGGVGREVHSEAPLQFRALASGDIIEETFALVYYGGATDALQSRLVDVTPGANIDGIDIPLREGRVRAFHVRGVVIDGMTGRPAPGASLRAIPLIWSPSLVAPAVTSDSNGMFDIPGVGSGSYSLAVNYSSDGIARNTIATIDVNESNVEGVQLVVTSGSGVPGHIVFEGGTTGGSILDATAMTVSLVPEDPALSAYYARSIKDNAFVLNGVQPGRYRVSISPILAGPGFPPYFTPAVPSALQDVYVKSIRIGTEDTLNSGVLMGSASRGEIEITIGANGGSLDGVVTDSRQQPASNAVVVLVPDSPALRRRMDLYKSTNADEAGRFSLHGISPGSYKLFSWDYASEGNWFDPEFVRPVEARGRAVGIAEGKNASVQLTMIGTQP